MADSQQGESQRNASGKILEPLNIVVVYIYLVKNFFKAPGRKSILGQIALLTGSGHGLGCDRAIKSAQQGCDLALA